MGRPASSPRGYTLLELLLAMAIFVFLGSMIVFLMRQAMNIFTSASTGSGLIDRVETVLPEIARDLEKLALPADTRPPYQPPESEEMSTGPGRSDRPKPPPVRVRLRSGHVVLRDVPEGPLKDVPCFYAAWVVDITGSRLDPVLLSAGERAGPGLKPIDPNSPEGGDYLPTGGRMEVCYVAIPTDPAEPSVLTLYRGWRTPVGGEKSLLDPANLDSVAEIQAACRPVETGVLHFGITWRRVNATNWAPTSGPSATGSDPYVGPVWDSTRALDAKWPLYRGPDGLVDPSDDIFPQWALIEMSLVRQRGTGTAAADAELAADLGQDDRNVLLGYAGNLPTGDGEHFLKVGSEWLAYRSSGVDLATGKVYVDRGVRGTTKAGHEAGDQVFSGLEARKIVRLLFLDGYVR